MVVNREEPGSLLVQTLHLKILTSSYSLSRALRLRLLIHLYGLQIPLKLGFLSFGSITLFKNGLQRESIRFNRVPKGFMGSCILTQNHLGHQLVRGKQPLVLVSDWFGRGLFFLEWLCRVESHQFRMSQILYHRIYYRNGIQVVIEYGVQLAIIVVITIITPFDGVDPNTNAPTPHRSIKPALPHSLTTILRQLSKAITPSTIPSKFMLNIGGVFVKERGNNYYKTIEREISERIQRKKELKEESYKVMALIVTLTKKEEYGLLRLETIKAIEDYQEELEDLNDLND